MTIIAKTLSTIGQDVGIRRAFKIAYPGIINNEYILAFDLNK